MPYGAAVCGNIGVKAYCQGKGRTGTTDAKVVSQVVKFVKASVTKCLFVFYLFICCKSKETLFCEILFDKFIR